MNTITSEHRRKFVKARSPHNIALLSCVINGNKDFGIAVSAGDDKRRR